ncbi:MAG TPA: hypothetical protein ENG42_02435, partial [Candidatus Aenigmarchaeota archaeon]|nr:hypothetical protein [Candidatus Aenigmarchaeota archaeon]
ALLAALLPYVLDGYRVIWTVKTGNETDRPIEELKEINKKLGTNFFGLSYRGKKDMCLLARERKLKTDYDGATFFCNMKRKECKYYANLAGVDIDMFLEKPLLYTELVGICKNLNLCPYFLQRILAEFASVLSLSYNYIVNEGIAWGIKSLIPFKNSILIVDEAHNLQFITSNVNSNRITTRTAINALKEWREFVGDDGREKLFITSLIEEMRGIYKYMKESNECEIRLNMDEFLSKVLAKEGLGFDEMFEILSKIKKVGTELRRQQIEANKSPRSSLYRLSLFLFDAISNINVRGVEFIAERQKDNIAIEIFDMRSEEILKNKWDQFRSVVFCSGTLRPINAFATTTGISSFEGKVFHTKINKENVKTFIIKGLSTAGEEIGKEMVRRYINALASFLKLPFNSAVFFSSYRVQEEIMNAGLLSLAKDMGKKVFIEYKGMSGHEARKILDEFKEEGKKGKKGLLLASMQGRFAEGADFPGSELEGIFIVGIPFDRLNLKTRLYLEYYKSLYGIRKGVYYGYVIPAMRRASQALGRAIRSKDDKAVFVLGDERYLQKRFFTLLPFYVKKTAISVELEKFAKLNDSYSPPVQK